MPVLKLERMDRESGLRYTDICYVWVNTDHIETFDPRSEGATNLTMASGARWLVGISPDDLAKALDPENACPDPNRCLYVSQYLARGPAELTHAGFHAAEREGARHIQNCTYTERTNMFCDYCAEHEQRVRV